MQERAVEREIGRKPTYRKRVVFGSVKFHPYSVAILDTLRCFFGASAVVTQEECFEHTTELVIRALAREHCENQEQLAMVRAFEYATWEVLQVPTSLKHCENLESSFFPVLGLGGG